MKLNPEQHEKLVSFIKTKWKPPYACACCGANNWNVTQEVFQMTEFTQAGLVLGGPVVPLAPVTCNNCGNTVLLNALMAGVVTTPEKKEEVVNAK